MNKFNVRMSSDKEEIKGQITFSKDSLFDLECLVMIVESFAKATNQETKSVLEDIWFAHLKGLR
jgi:hypothetical protein